MVPPNLRAGVSFVAGRGDDSESAIVAAFLRAGHPGLAFATVALRTLVKPVVAAGGVATGIALGKFGLEWAVNHLPGLMG